MRTPKITIRIREVLVKRDTLKDCHRKMTTMSRKTYSSSSNSLQFYKLRKLFKGPKKKRMTQMVTIITKRLLKFPKISRSLITTRIQIKLNSTKWTITMGKRTMSKSKIIKNRTKMSKKLIMKSRNTTNSSSSNNYNLHKSLPKPPKSSNLMLIILMKKTATKWWLT